MPSVHVHLAPDIPGLPSLGLDEARAALAAFEDGGTLTCADGWAGSVAERCSLVDSQDGRTLARVPLPGTPDERGRVHERPRGAGTGWLWWLRYDERAPWRERARVRLRAPRSASLAGRDWNVICHLRAHGVATPEPVALFEEGSGFVARRSALFVRELEDWTRLDHWLARAHDDAAWRGVAGALGEVLARVRRAGVVLPAARLADFWVAPDEACGRSPAPAEGLRVRRRPAVAISGFRGARLATWSDADLARCLRQLDDEALSIAAVPERARAFVAHRALGHLRALNRALNRAGSGGRARSRADAEVRR